jgi:RNA polymerase sigma-70 factor, ECF subfamily
MTSSSVWLTEEGQLDASGVGERRMLADPGEQGERRLQELVAVSRCVEAATSGVFLNRGNSPSRHVTSWHAERSLDDRLINQAHDTDLYSAKADAAMARYAAGDDGAFPMLRDALLPRLERYVARNERDSDRAQDLVQATFERLVLARGRFVIGSRVTPWALCILRRLHIDQLRRRRELRLLDGDDEPLQPSCDDPTPDTCVESKEVVAMIRGVVAELPRLQREACELVYFDQMQYSEVAEVLGVTIAAIKQRVLRAHRAMRAELIVAATERDAVELSPMGETKGAWSRRASLSASSRR